MPRQKRMKSISGYYHVIIRGVSKQLIFEEDADRRFFLAQLARYSRLEDVDICAYCLMENHVHLLVRDLSDHLSSMMHKLCGLYAHFFNLKYERSGHLFQNRFLSEIINDEKHLLTVFRYILKNPEKAGICHTSQYQWSSYMLYNKRNSFVNTALIAPLIGDCELYQNFINAEDRNAHCLEYTAEKYSDLDALQMIKEKCNIVSGTSLQNFERQKRNEAVKMLRQKGLSIRQIERLTGISRGQIQRIKP